MGYSVIIYVNNIPVVNIYDSNNKCIPYQEITPLDYKGNKNDIITIATFDFVLLITMMFWMRERSLNNKELMNSYKVMLSHLVQMKKNYFNINKNKNILDDTPFVEFVITCKGETMDARKERSLKVEKKKERKKTLYLEI